MLANTRLNRANKIRNQRFLAACKQEREERQYLTGRDAKTILDSGREYLYSSNVKTSGSN